MSRLALVFCLAASLAASDYRTKLPTWASTVAMAAQTEAPPVDADAWVLLDRTEIAYVGDGEIRQRRYRLVQVLSERGRNQATFTLRGLGGKASKVKNLKGWNLRPDGELVKLDQDEVVTIHDAGSAEFSTETLTGVTLDRVKTGSLVAFESLESITSPLGPVAQEFILEPVPVRRWELEVAKKDGWFTNLKAVGIAMVRRHFLPWVSQIEEVAGSKLALSNLPALPKDEGAHPDLENILPSVQVRFLDPAFETARMWNGWDGLAKWTQESYRVRLVAPVIPDLNGATGLDGLKSLVAWMGRSLTYKQVYLTPERGWVPERSDEVGRKRYGDCKDLSCFLIAGALNLGFQAHPVLAVISGPQVDPAEAPFPRFNHVIAGIRLAKSLGLPAEVDTPHGRFLLVDPTDPLTPLGFLSGAHRGRHVMICLESGAQWVRIPDTAIQPSRLELDVEGEATDGGSLTAILQIEETGNAWDLRNVAKSLGAKGVRDRLVRDLLELPPTGNLEVQSLGDPADLSKPFVVKAKVEHPRGFRLNGGERELVGWGIPGPRGVIQKVGVPRRYPIQSRGQTARTLNVRLKVPGHIRPVATERSEDTAFATYSWQAKAEAEAGGSILTVRFDHRWKDVDFGFDQLEAGLQAWKKDRNQFKGFREEALSFKILP